MVLLLIKVDVGEGFSLLSLLQRAGVSEWQLCSLIWTLVWADTSLSELSLLWPANTHEGVTLLDVNQ